MLVRALAPLAVFVIVLAGCANPSPEAPQPAAPVPLAPPAFSEPVPMAQVGGGEPNIAILADDTMFVASPAGLSKPNVHEGGAYLWRSRDQGRTWDTLRQPYLVPQQEQQGVPAGPFCSCDADVVASPDGWVYYADWWIAGLVGPGQYIIEASPDGGRTWNANSATIPENLLASVDREWLVPGKDGFVALFYSFYGECTPVVGRCAPALPGAPGGLDRPGNTIEAIFSTDHGKTFTTPIPIVQGSGMDNFQIAHPFIAPNGTILMAYGMVHSPQNGGFWLDPSEVRLTYSGDQGLTWKDISLAKAPLGFDNLWAVQGAVDASTGEVTVVWAARDSGVANDKVSAGSTLGVWVKQFGPLGDYPAYEVRTSGQNFLPWAAARDGRAAVGWYGGDQTGDMTKAPSSADWFAYAAVAPHGIFNAGNVSIGKVSATPVKSGPICPKGAACNGDRELLDYVSLVFDSKGFLHYTFTQSEKKQPHVHVVNQVP